MKKITYMTLLLLNLLNLVACGVSPEEKEQRRANAFDLQGRYEVNVINSSSGMVLNIENEEDRSNVLGIIDRDGFTTAEEQAFARQNIPMSRVDKFRTRFKIGKGRHGYLEGGENISDDLGESSRLYICTNDNENAHHENIDIDYMIDANISKNDFTLRGKIILSITKSEYVNNAYQWTELERVEIPFEAKSKGLFFRQYFGTWDGMLEVDASSIREGFSNITISGVGEEGFSVNGARSQFSYDGESFRIDNVTKSLEDLSESEYPEIEIKYNGSRGNRIVLFGNIYSLGLFTGAIVFMNEFSEEQVGMFKFKRR